MLKRIKQYNNTTIKFLIVGFVGFVCNYIVLHILSGQFNVHKILAEIIAIVLALQVTFFLHDHWTYIREEENDSLKVSLRSRYALYIASNALSSSSTVAVFSILIMFIHVDIIVLLMATIIQTTWNYLVNRFVIWKRESSKV